MPFENEFPDEPCLCPRCKAVVHPLANQCPACGEYFPNTLQRTGDVWGGALCGAARGVGLVGFVVAGIAAWKLFTPPHPVGAAFVLVIGVVVFMASMTIAGRLDQRTYHRD